MAEQMVHIEQRIISFLEGLMSFVAHWQEIKQRPGMKFLKALLNSLL